jgi:integrase
MEVGDVQPEDLRRRMLAAGCRPSVVDVTVTTLGGLGRDGVDWETVDGADLVRRCVGRPERLHRLRRGLLHAFPDGVAQRRWPEVYRRVGSRGVPGENVKMPTLENVLPKGLLTRQIDDPMRALFELLFRKLCRRGGMRVASSFRVNLSFLYGFLCATPASLWPDAHTVSGEELQRRVRDLTHEGLVRAYDRYRQESSRVDRNLSLQALCTQLSFLNVVFRDVFKVVRRPLHATDFGILTPSRKRKRLGEAASVSTVGNSTMSSALSAFHEEAPIVDRSATGWLCEPKKSTVHCFNAAETRKLYLACETDLERLLISALFTTGMRIGGFCLALRAGAILGHPPAPVVVGPLLTTNEKGNVVREYAIARGLACLLPAWVATGGCGERYLFPGTAGGERPMDTRRARAVFMGLAGRAGLTGSHVKPHTTRHTVFWTLSALGNKLEEVADFAGHRSPAVTNKVYIAMEEAVKRSRMNIPWLETDGRTGTERLQDVALELAGAIAGPFASEDRRTFPDYRRLNDRPQQRPRVVVVDPPPDLDKSHHRAVADASVQRAERKAEKRAKKQEFKETLRRQMADNAVLLGKLVARR